MEGHVAAIETLLTDWNKKGAIAFSESRGLEGDRDGRQTKCLAAKARRGVPVSSGATAATAQTNLIARRTSRHVWLTGPKRRLAAAAYPAFLDHLRVSGSLATEDPGRAKTKGRDTSSEIEFAQDEPDAGKGL
jgi:hypothetical protein